MLLFEHHLEHHSFSVSYLEYSDNNAQNLYNFRFYSLPFVILRYQYTGQNDTPSFNFIENGLKKLIRVFIINNSCVSDRIPAGSDTDKMNKSPILNHKQNNRYEFQKCYHLSIMCYNLSCIIYHALSSKTYILP